MCVYVYNVQLTQSKMYIVHYGVYQVPGILLCAGLRITNSIPTRTNIASFIIKHSLPFLPGNHGKSTFDVICCKHRPANFPFHRPIPIISNIDPHEISIASPSSLSPQPHTYSPHRLAPINITRPIYTPSPLLPATRSTYIHGPCPIHYLHR